MAAPNPPSTETGTGSGDAKAIALSLRGNVPNQTVVECGATESGKCLAWPGAFVIHRPEVLGIVRMVLIGRASVRRISRRRSEEGQGEKGRGGSRRWVPPSPARLSTHDCRPRPTPLPPERPPPISRAVLSSEPNWYSTRGVHTHKKESSKGKRGGGASQRPSPVCRPTSTVRAHQPSRERSELCVQQSSTVLPGHTPGTRTPSVASLSHQGGRPPRRARGRSGSTAGSGRLGGGGRGGGPTPPHGRETSPPAIRELQRL